jgi:hypothetical protein
MPSWPWRRAAEVQQARSENCTQTVIAALCRLPVPVVEQLAGTAARMTVQDTLDLLRRLGVTTQPVAASLASAFWGTFSAQHGGRRLRGVGVALPREGHEIGHAYALMDRSAVDPASGDRVPLSAEQVARFDWLILLPPNVDRLPGVQQMRSAGIHRKPAAADSSPMTTSTLQITLGEGRFRQSPLLIPPHP